MKKKRKKEKIASNLSATYSTWICLDFLFLPTYRLYKVFMTIKKQKKRKTK
jgi:hypothetical protein